MLRRGKSNLNLITKMLSSRPSQSKPDFSQALDYACEKCNGTLFAVRFLIKKFSALTSPTGEETLNPIQVFSCIGCNHVNQDFLPANEQIAAP